MSHACSAAEMSDLFGPAILMPSTNTTNVRILSPHAQRYLVLHGHAIPIGERRSMVIGSDPAHCDMPLLSARIEARHAELFFHNGCYFVQDLGSVHGTYVNGRRIAGAAELHVGDEILIKPYSMTFTTAGLS